MDAVNKNKIYTKEAIDKIADVAVQINEISNAAIHKRINKMIALDGLSRVGNGQYLFNGKKKFDYDLTNAISINVFSKLNKKLDKSAKYIVYESTILNTFLNHLIGRATIIVEVEKELVESVFWFLKEEGFKNILLNPSENENYIYNPYDGSGIIIKTMVSKSPINNKHHKITIEKLVVDIICDKTLNMFFEGAEIPNMVEDILKNYAVKFDSVRNYAKRRHGLEKLICYYPDIMEPQYC